ncbi:MAG: post-transcriptional regulator [Tumebacillaceae bacterium]
MSEELEQGQQPESQPEEKTHLTEQELNEEIAEICNSKAEEMHMLGYEQVTGADVWNCVSSKYKKGLPPLHRLINDILTLKSTQFMNWLMMNAYRES